MKWNPEHREQADRAGAGDRLEIERSRPAQPGRRVGGLPLPGKTAHWAGQATADEHAAVSEDRRLERLASVLDRVVALRSTGKVDPTSTKRSPARRVGGLPMPGKTAPRPVDPSPLEVARQPQSSGEHESVGAGPSRIV